ncbi:DUF3898 domain-containing protein [Bacillus sp. SL00103]
MSCSSEADQIVFEKGSTPVEFHKPNGLKEVVSQLTQKSLRFRLRIRQYKLPSALRRMRQFF